MNYDIVLCVAIQLKLRDRRNFLMSDGWPQKIMTQSEIVCSYLNYRTSIVTCAWNGSAFYKCYVKI